ncbi:MAG: cyclopropane-fatty-acyl-phospholipid synthase family protein [Rhodovibrionaceae bacterium]
MALQKTFDSAPAKVHPLVAALGRQIHAGRLRVVFPDGGALDLAGPQAGPDAEVRLHRPGKVLRRLVASGDLGFAECYMDGDFDTPDLSALLALAARNYEHWQEILSGSAFYRALQRLLHLARPNTQRGAKRNIAYHYDLGNGFYEAWLDPSMTYSAACFEAPEQSLENAQLAKYRRLAAQLDLQPGQRLLEIGCGWGGFAEYAAREAGVEVTAVTISHEQYAYAKQRIRRANLDNQVEIRLQDYRDVEERFDRIASIEMFEAVGEAYWPLFFRKVHDSLKAGGRAALQIITIDETAFDSYRRGADFIQRYIFPGGMLPSLPVLKQETSTAGLTWLQEQAFGQDYARTLASWHARFERAWPKLRAEEGSGAGRGGGFDERFRRMWTYYLAYCEAGFLSGRIDVRQIALARA